MAPSHLTRLLIASGAPIGDKITQRFEIPKWLMNSSKLIKREFLATIFGNEGCSLVKDSHGKTSFYPPVLTMCKIDKLQTNHIEFLEQIKSLLIEFDITSTIKEQSNKFRKDGTKAIKYVVCLDRNLRNLLRFYNEIGFIYAKHKSELYKERLRNFISSFIKILKNIQLYKEVMKLRDIGYGTDKCCKLLNIKENTDKYHLVHSWIYHNCKPSFLYAEEDIKKFLNSLDSTASFTKSRNRIDALMTRTPTTSSTRN